MAKIIGIAGSLRKGSYNAALLATAVELAPDELTIEVSTIRDIPLYDGDVEVERGIPDAVTALKDQIAEADGLLLATPEYNNSIPGVLKNAIDWLTRPPKDIARVFHHKHVALMGASPGPGGTGLAQAAWLPVLRTLRTCPFFGPRVQIASASALFDEEGTLIDERARATLAKFLQEFSAVISPPSFSRAGRKRSLIPSAPTPKMGE